MREVKKKSPSKSPAKKPAVKKPTGAKRQQFTTYSNLAKNQGKSKHAIKKDEKNRARAEYLATLPKNPVKRFFARLHPKRVFKYWFSMRGLKMIGKIVGVTLLVMALAAGALFMYFRKELDSLRPEELAKRVQTTVNKYYDRNGELLWEDKGTGTYRLVVESEQISQYMKDATVAIEDKDFHNHGGVSFTGMLRAVVNNVRGNGDVQGGSTLTQQLIKQVFFYEESGERGVKGVPRKIKEAILSVEAERIYTKDQILSMYLNESPYGGRRNGVESAAQTYFGKSAKDLTLAESALLASIPQSPTRFNPYAIAELCTGTNAETNECSLSNNSLIRRQHTVLDKMAEQGYVKQAQADEAKAVPILDTIKPEDDGMQDAKAPHFIQMVKRELTEKLGAKVVGQGGLTIKTTLDLRVQNVLEGTMNDLFNGKYAYLPRNWGADNASFTMVDNQTGQVLGVMGSRDYNYPDYGAVNSATSFIQPGSSIKPLVYAALIDNQENPNGTYGAGSIIADSPIPQNIYRTSDGTSVRNADNKFKGNIPLRQGLGESRNVPAIKAMALNGVDETMDFMRAAGNTSYCTDGADQSAGLAASIGGCGAKQVEHANAFGTIARGGVYKPDTTIIEAQNSQGKKVYEWKDEGKQVMDPQTAFIISDILTDGSARSGVFGSCAVGFCTNGIKTGTKTGTSNIGKYSKDLWMMSYTPKATLAVWAGNHVPKGLKSGDGMSLGPLVRDINTAVYKIFESDGTYKKNDWFTQPAGIQKLSVSGKNDIFPSWYNKNQKTAQTVKMTFDRISKRKATDCTPAAAREELDVIKNVDPITKQTTFTAPEGYDANADDNVHSCSDVAPFVSVITATPLGGGRYSVSVLVRAGTHSVSEVIISLNGNSYNASQGADGDWSIVVADLNGSYDVSARAIDGGYYSGEGSQNLTFSSGGGTP